MNHPSGKPSRIVLADNSDLLLIGACTMLKPYPECQVLGTAGDFHTLLKLTQHYQPDIIVFGDQLDPENDIPLQMKQLKVVAPYAKLVLMCVRASGARIHEWLADGIDGVLCKLDMLETHLYCAVLAMRRSRPYLSPTASAEYLVTMQSPYANKSLDAEARQVLQLLSEGEHVGQISARLSIDKRRVYWVREKLRQRFGARTNEHLIQRALVDGFIHPHD